MSGHNNVEIDPNQPYQPNVIGMKGIAYFFLGLFMLIVITFVLMYVFQYYFLEEQWNAADKRNASPIALSAEEKLPPEPRLQGAPGFGVDSKDGWVNLELREPQAEYRELLRQWEDVWENGEERVDPATKEKVRVSLPIKEAKEKLLSSGTVKSSSGEDAEENYVETTTTVSSSSAGRTRTDRIR